MTPFPPPDALEAPTFDLCPALCAMFTPPAQWNEVAFNIPSGLNSEGQHSVFNWGVNLFPWGPNFYEVFHSALCFPAKNILPCSKNGSIMDQNKI